MLDPQVGGVCHPDPVTGIGLSKFPQKVWTVAEVVLAVGAQRLEALLLPAFDTQLLHQPKGPVPSALKGLVLQVFADRAVPVAATGLLAQLCQLSRHLLGALRTFWRIPPPAGPSASASSCKEPLQAPKLLRNLLHRGPVD